MSLPARCIDLTEDHIDAGLVSVESMRVLLEHLSHIARPKEGAAKILVAISRIATTSCEWLEGALHVEVVELLGASEIAVMSDLGGGVRELIFPRLLVDVSHEELVRAVKLAPRLISPLNFRVRGDRMILRRNAGGTVAPPAPAFEIAEESLRRSLPPALRRSLPPVAPAADSVEAGTQGVVLARLFPKTQRTLVFDAPSDLDVGWDFGAYSSTVNTRETKPPPPPKTPSKVPTRPPPEAPPPPPFPPPLPAPRARTTKAPPRPPEGGRRIVIRKKGSAPAPVKKPRS